MNILARNTVGVIRNHGILYVLAGLIIMLSWGLVWGDHGLMEYRALQNDQRESVAALETITADRMSLEVRVKHLRPESLDLDLLEEQAKIILGFSHPDERVIILR